MSSKFDNVPSDEGTAILFGQEMKLGDFDVLYQKWHWEGITAESIIFANADIVGLSDKEIEAEVKASPLLQPGSSTTLTRTGSGFTFVNFNFGTE